MNKTLLISLLLVVMSAARLWAQVRDVSGTVSTDEGTGGFPGATVVIKGTEIGTLTDANGAYRLNVPPSGTTLVFSAVGMQTVEETIGGRTTANV